MPGSSKHDKQIKAQQAARKAARAKKPRSSDGVQGSGEHRVYDGTAQDGRDGPARQVGPVPTAKNSTVVWQRVPISHTATPWVNIGASGQKYLSVGDGLWVKENDYTAAKNGEIVPVYCEIDAARVIKADPIVGATLNDLVPIPGTKYHKVDVLAANGYTPEYVKPGRLSGFFARRTGKRIHQLSRLWFGKKEKQVVSPQEQKAQELKFNVSTAAGKGVDPLLSKKAAGVVALITMVLSGYMGHEVAVDQMSIDAAIQQGVAIWMAVNMLIAGVTWFYKVVRNVYTEWGRIKEHGVKISGENAAFDFAPRDGD